MPGKRELIREKTASPLRWLIPTAIVGVLVLVCAGFCIAAASRSTIVPHTSIGGVDVSGLTQEEAAQRIRATLDSLLREQGIRVTLENGEEAAYMSYEALGVRFDVDALARDAYEASHSGNPVADGWMLLGALLGHETEVMPRPVEGWTVNAAKLLAEAATLEPEDFAFEVDDDNHLFMTKQRDGRTVDVSALRARLVDSTADEQGTRVVELPYTVQKAETGDLAAINNALGGEMANARYDVATQTITTERMALNFDIATAQALLDAADPGETISIPSEISAPQVTAEDLRKVLFRDVLSTYTTRVGGAAGRKSNVKLTASRVNGAILNSGEEFNYYKLCGPFSASNGYQSAPGYLHGKTVEMDGGGACQCSSTTYAAALLANLEIVARTNHGFASDYIGLGLDATVSGGGPDFIFRNNTLYPIKVKTNYSSDNHLTVTIIGTKTDDITVKMRTEVLSTTPYSEQIIEDPTLAPGTRVVDTTPYTGYTVNTYRQLYDGNGKLISEKLEAYSKYNKRDRIIKVGPALPEAPVETPVETPIETPVETPVAPIETPVTPIETPVAPVETPVAPIEIPITPVEPPVAPVETPVVPTEPVEAPVETPHAEAPVVTPTPPSTEPEIAP